MFLRQLKPTDSTAFADGQHMGQWKLWQPSAEAHEGQRSHARGTHNLVETKSASELHCIFGLVDINTFQSPVSSGPKWKEIRLGLTSVRFLVQLVGLESSLNSGLTADETHHVQLGCTQLPLQMGQQIMGLQD